MHSSYLTQNALLLVLVVLGGVGVAVGDDISCQTFTCPTGRERTTDVNVMCPDVVQNTNGTSCEELSTDNIATCCPDAIKGTDTLNLHDDFRPVIAANVVGAVPLAVVIVIAVWSFKSINTKENEELDKLRENVLLFEELEEETIRRSYRSSMFIGSVRRKSMSHKYGPGAAGTTRASSYSMMNIGLKQMVITVDKQEGADLGFAIESMQVVAVEPDSPAERAGLTKGMQIKKINDLMVNPSNIAEIIKSAGQRFTVTVMVKDPTARDGTDYLSAARSNGSFTYGSTMASFRNSRLVRIRLDKGEGCVLGMQLTGLDVTSLKPGGIAEEAGVKVGMQVHSVSGQKATITNVTKLVQNAPQSFLVDFIQEFHFADEDMSYCSAEPASKE
eukprot:TRINITY_DN5966_c0_g2_i2.p1 TRINITY_DN5966_c0_g2~~TRINITY_DN5966_c0_g2_i2.p1  ORF type:complete len:404 (+),score=79.81 TRINITY_DN5966_c0_g2_i2:51-1214(+)